MDRPRLRALEAFPLPTLPGVEQRLIALRDPSGLSDAVAALPPVAVAVVQLFNGESTREQICEEFQRQYGRPLSRTALDHLVDQLDEALLLDSERFRRHAVEVHAEFSRSPVRPAYLAGRSYPADPVKLAELLDGFFTAPNGPGPTAPKSAPLPHALIAPHIDFHRGGPAYAWAYRPLADADSAPELVVLFGTDHNGADHPFSLTRKHYDTPLGSMQTDAELVDAWVERVRARLGNAAAERLFADEPHHRGEHSLEFQAVWLRHVLKDAADSVRVVPILCGSLHQFVADGESPAKDHEIATVLDELRALTLARRTVYIAGADLAHVGPRFGDPEPLQQLDREALEARDLATIRHLERGDAEGWFGELEGEQDCRRVCGLPPIYALLYAARPSDGRLLAYDQCPADEDGGSRVSIASVAFARRR
jgi:AmmeMemoRadiSam system protein B